jgi:hypothetical protein
MEKFKNGTKTKEFKKTKGFKSVKKVAFCAVTAVTCFGMTAFTACGEVSDEEYVDNVVEATQNQEVVGFGGSLKYNGTSTSDVPMAKYYSVSQSSMTGNITFDALTGNADCISSGTTKSKEYNLTSYSNKSDSLDGVEAVTTYEMSFLRDIYLFNTTSQTEIKDYNSSVTLNLVETSEDTSSYLNGLLTMLKGEGEDEESGVDISGEISAITQLAITYDALNISSGVLTIDVAKIISGVYADFNATLESIDGKTTVSQILENENFKKIFTASTSGVDVQEVYDTIVQSLTESEKVDSTVVAAVPKPTEGQSLYDYIVAVVKDEDFNKALLGEASIGNMSLDYLLTLNGAYSVDTIKTMIASALNVTTADDGSVVITAGMTGGQTTITLKKVQLALTVAKDYSLKSIGITLDVSYTGGSLYSTVSSQFTADANLTLYTDNSMPKLVDISNCTVYGQEQTVAQFLASKSDLQ